MKKQRNHQPYDLPTIATATTGNPSEYPPSLSTLSMRDGHSTNPTDAISAGKTTPFKRQLGTRTNYRSHKNQLTTRRGMNEGREKE